jgi:hypothetical protein
MMVLMDAPMGTAVTTSSAASPADGTAALTAALQRAQQVADELVAQAERDAAETTAKAHGIELQAGRLHDEAARVAEEAQLRLTQAQEQGQELVRDATAQATVLMQIAGRNRDQMLTEARTAATAERVAAKVEREALAAQAEQVLAQARDQAASTVADGEAQRAARLSELTGIEHARRMDAERGLQLVHEQATAQATEMVEAARGEAASLTQAATAEAAELRAAAAQHHADLSAQALAQLEEAESEIAAQLLAAAEEAAAIRDDADTLLSSAKLEIERWQAVGHRELAAALAARRRQLQTVLNRSATGLRQRSEAAASRTLEVEELRAKTLAEAQAQATEITRAAEVSAEQTVAKAAAHLAHVEKHAQVRLDEAEGSARVLREDGAAEIMRAQAQAQEIVSAARLEAEQIRLEAAQAKEVAAAEGLALLDEARAEVEVLKRKRLAIVTELGGLSGIISALAVPDSSGEVLEPLAESE